MKLLGISRMVLNILIHLLKFLQKSNLIISLEYSRDLWRLEPSHFLTFLVMTATEFLHFIVSSLVTNTEAIQIEEKHDELGTLLSLRVDPTDM